ncbi:hypothetical protein PZ897_06370 [Hoeflea sp. YIM 152468]|uniref:hypothetical protein n=1 Tax=Hoeflea sp. YIM 152468 TaxID=3031759 RepID=UPI0023DC9A87|nr:hypothetical protein [Hoeflea sp. YIM 152468]MDF1607797.1 hypothetical protein [Hoeflea sp. YIM 152468]
MNSPVRPFDFLMPADAHPRLRDFYALWLAQASAGLPVFSVFDLHRLSADYPLLARIGLDEAGETLMWRDVASTRRWPFKQPVKDRPLLESVPPPSVKRVVATLNQTLTSGVPDYYETTSWMHGGSEISLARLAVPVLGDAGRELILSWEVIEPAHIG